MTMLLVVTPVMPISSALLIHITCKIIRQAALYVVAIHGPTVIVTLTVPVLVHGDTVTNPSQTTYVWVMVMVVVKIYS